MDLLGTRREWSEVIRNMKPLDTGATLRVGLRGLVLDSDSD